MEKTITLISPRGFCAGVTRAIDTVDQALLKYETPLYVHHEIVHNTYIVDNLKKKGVIFIDNLDEMPDELPVILSAHGVHPDVRKKAANKNLHLIDATCPLVTKVHSEALRYARAGFNIVYIGHKKHVEALGTAGEAPDKIVIVENEKDIDNLPFSRESKIACLTQTTLSIFETEHLVNYLKQKFSSVSTPSAGDICYATTNRQKAVAEIAGKVDLIFVIGSSNSSNSNRLKEVAIRQNPRSYLINCASEIQSSWLNDDINSIGITAGASAPEILVTDVINILKTDYGFYKINMYNGGHEDLHFSLPENI